MDILLKLGVIGKDNETEKRVVHVANLPRSAKKADVKKAFQGFCKT